MPSTISLTAYDRRRHHSTEDAKQQNKRQRGLIYFICGNPGLIDFYQDFLGCLAEMIRASDVPEKVSYDIYGRNLLGFDSDDGGPLFGRSAGEKKKPWDLEEQIEGICADIFKQQQRKQGEDEEGVGYDFVVLMGHSVGAYIAVEIMARHMRRCKQQRPSGGGGHHDDLNLRNGVLLFPTLTHIAESPSGKKASVLLSVPFVGDYAHVAARWVTALVPSGVVKWWLERMSGFSEQTAAVVVRWLKSKGGIWQSIFLGRSEMRTIREDVWEEELWEAAGSSATSESDAVPHQNGNVRGKKFYVFYGREDHWVANKWRDEIVEKRKDVARIIVDEGDVPHAFCTREGKSLYPLLVLIFHERI